MGDERDDRPGPWGEESVTFLSAIVENIGHPVFVKDREFSFVLVNRAFSEMTGFDREQLLGKTDYDFFKEEEADFFRQKDKEMFRTGSVVTIEEEPITDADGTVHVLATTKVPLANDRGEVTHLVGIIKDITQLKNVEAALKRANDELEQRVAERTRQLEEAQEQLIRRERLAALGQLAGGVAHQIRNPLAAIANANALLRRHLEGDDHPESAQAVEIIREEVQRADGIIRELLDYGRVRPPERAAVTVGEIVDAALKDHVPPGAISVNEKIDAKQRAWVDEAQMVEAIGNLLQNAFDAMPDGGTVTVSAKAKDEEIIVAVQDEGTGIDDDQRDRLFEPLVTTKAYGLGLGLPIAKALIDNQGGSIRFEPAPSGGARFEIALPRPPE
jgi:PAS domain S-box-containing protein